jgi:hypothetical protein
MSNGILLCALLGESAGYIAVVCSGDMFWDDADSAPAVLFLMSGVFPILITASCACEPVQHSDSCACNKMSIAAVHIFVHWLTSALSWPQGSGRI